MDQNKKKRILVVVGTCLVLLTGSLGIFFCVDTTKNREIGNTNSSNVGGNEPTATPTSSLPAPSSLTTTLTPTTNLPGPSSPGNEMTQTPTRSVSVSSPEDSVPTPSPTNTISTFEHVGCIKSPIEPTLDIQQTVHQYITIEEDIVYGKGATTKGEINLKLDLYHPSFHEGYQKFPLMIHIHGGSFISGSKSDGYIVSLSEFWAHHGFVVASIDYRLMGNSPILSEEMREVYEYAITNLSEVLKSEAQGVAAVCAVEDTLLAYNYLKNFEFVDSNVVVMNGYSAGAITALWVTYGVDNFGVSRPPVKAVMSHWGMLVPDEKEANNLVRNNDEPPTFLVHATGDSIVPYEGTQYLANRLENLDIPYGLHCQQSGSHAINIESVTHSEDKSILDVELIWVQNVLLG
jgi:dienelactone hydrolase